MLKFLVVDDHAVMRRGLRELLNDEWAGALVGEAEDGRDALQRACSDAWDLIVLDISMPHATGLDVLRQFKASRPCIPVVILSAHSAPYYVQASLCAGAAGYVSKDAASDELLQAVHTVLGGGKYISRCLAHGLHGQWPTPRSTASQDAADTMTEPSHRSTTPGL
jgi:two-component system, NarL family, invasion response regulator UvrY